MSTKTIFLPFSSKKVLVKKELDHPIYWHDTESNKMWTFYGGKLIHEWNQKLKRLVPRVEWDKDKKRWKCKNTTYRSVSEKSDNKKDIIRWIKEIGNSIGVELNEEESRRNGIAIDIETNNERLIEHSLDRNDIKFEEI